MSAITRRCYHSLISLLESGHLRGPWRSLASGGILRGHVTLGGIAPCPYPRQPRPCCLRKVRAKFAGVPVAVTTVTAPTGQSPHFLVFRVLSQYPQLLPGEEVMVPTLAIEAGAPTSGHKHYSYVATGGRSKLCILWFWRSARGQCACFAEAWLPCGHSPLLAPRYGLLEACGA